MAAIKIQIGATVNADMGRVVFAPLVKAAKAAAQEIHNAFRDAVGAHTFELGGAGGYRAAPASAGVASRRAKAKAALSDLEKDVRDSAKRRVALEAAAMREVDALLAKSSKDKQRQFAAEDRAIASAARRNQHIADSSALRMSGGAVRTFGGIVSGAVRRGVGIASDVARGAGVDFSLSSGIHKRVAQQAAIVDLVNAGYIEGAKGPAGTRASEAGVAADINRVGGKFGVKQETLTSGLQTFVGKTGELQTGRDMLEMLAATAKATGADFDDVAGAAAAIANKLGDVPDKAKAVNSVMMALAGQGKVGAVEIKDLATQMEKLTSMSTKFAGNKEMMKLVGSESGANIAMLGVFAQAARRTEKGTAAQATQASMAFIRDLTGDSVGKRLAIAHISRFTDSTHQKLRDPQEIIKDILSYTKGDVGKLSHVMPNQNSRAVVNSFVDPYMAASNAAKAGGATAKQADMAGRAAVDAAMKELKDATLSDKAQQEALGKAMETTATKAEQFQQRLDKLTGDLGEKLVPKLLELVEPTGALVTNFTKITSWAAENPLKAVFAALGGAVVWSAAKEALRAGVEKYLVGALAKTLGPWGASNTVLGGGGAGGLGGGAGGAIGALTAFVGALAAAAAAIVVTEQILEAGMGKLNTLLDEKDGIKKIKLPPGVKPGGQFELDENGNPVAKRLPGAENLANSADFDAIINGATSPPGMPGGSKIGHAVDLARPEESEGDKWTLGTGARQGQGESVEAMGDRIAAAYDKASGKPVEVKGGTINIGNLAELGAMINGNGPVPPAGNAPGSRTPH
jgi:hypothetical protein